MVKQGLRETMLFILGVVAIISVCRCELGEYPMVRYERIIAQKRLQYTTEISEEEVKGFARLWPEYKSLGLDKDFNVSYLAVLPEEAMDWKRKLWFIYHHWDANRFFYVQQRIGYLLQAIEIRRNAQAVLDVLENRHSPLDEQMKELQKKRINAAEISFSELLIVSSREQELRELLKQ